MQRNRGKVKCVWIWGAIKKPLCGTWVEIPSLELETTEVSKGQGQQVLSVPLALGSLSKAPQRRQSRKILFPGHHEAGEMVPERRSCLLVAGHGGGGGTGPRSLKGRNKEQGQRLSSVRKKHGWQGVWPGAGWSWLPRCRTWDGMNGPEGELERGRLRSWA